MENFKFKYFSVLSSRSFFYNQLNKNNLNSLVKIKERFYYEDLNIPTCHWDSFTLTELGKYIINNNFYFSSHAHEGLTFDYSSCKIILSFLDKNDEIKNNLFNWNSCVEEFALQTICVNLSDNYFTIGNGTQDMNEIDTSKLPKDRYTYKIRRN